MKLSNVDFNLFKVFVTVYQEKSLRKASEKLFVTTPAVSQSIKKLKESLGEELFVLSKKQFLPTPFSDNLFKKIFPLLEGISIAIEEERTFKPEELSDNFHLEINPHILPWLTPSIFKQIQKESPRSTLISHTISQHSLEKLQQGSIDFVIHFGTNSLPAELIAVPLITLRFVLAVRKDHPHTQVARTMDDLLDYPFAHVDLAYFEQNRNSRLEEEMVKQGKTINMALRTTSLVGLIETVKQTNIIAPCLPPVIDQYKNDIRAMSVEGMDSVENVEVFAYMHKKNQHSAKYTWLLDLIETSIERFSPQ